VSLRTVTRILAVTTVALVATACGAASIAVDPTAAPTTAAPSTAASAATGASSALTWTVTDTSKVTVRVREQLASLNFPSDAVLVASGAKGAFTVNDDGTFAPGSQITFDVSSLTSDQSQRDSFVKQSVLNTRQFPTATFVPTKATGGLTLPLAATAHATFTLTGKLTIHGTTKDVTFTVDCTGTAAISPPRPRSPRPSHSATSACSSPRPPAAYSAWSTRSR